VWALRSSCRREPPPRAKLGRPAQVVVPGGGLFALATGEVRARLFSLHYARLHARRCLGWSGRSAAGDETRTHPQTSHTALYCFTTTMPACGSRIAGLMTPRLGRGPRTGLTGRALTVMQFCCAVPAVRPLPRPARRCCTAASCPWYRGRPLWSRCLCPPGLA